MFNKCGVFMPWIAYVCIVLTVCFFISAGSCTFTTQGLIMLSGDYTSPTLEDFVVTSEEQALLSVSREVTFSELRYYELSSDVSLEKTIIDNESMTNEQLGAKLVGEISIEKIDKDYTREDETGTIEYSLTFPEKTQIQLQYIVSGIIKDTIGNTLSFSLGFSGYNARVPHVIFSEVSTEYSKPRTEFIEFFVLEDGNLAGMVLQSATDGYEKDYVFPFVEVKRGDYVVLHMRTVEEGAVNELGDDITLSQTKQSSLEGRDLWISGTDTRLSKNDVLILRERESGAILDAIAYTDGIKTQWPKPIQFTFAQLASNETTWKGGVDVGQAINIEYITGTRTLCRQNISETLLEFTQYNTIAENSKANWIIVATSNASPGRENSTIQYSK